MTLLREYRDGSQINETVSVIAALLYICIAKMGGVLWEVHYFGTRYVTSCDRKSFGLHRKNSRSCSDNCHHWRFWSALRHFRTHFAESFHVSKSAWTMDPTSSREMPSCSAIDLAEIRQSSKISSWIWSIISRVVTFGSSRTRRITGGEITTFKLGHPVFYGGIRWCTFP